MQTKKEIVRNKIKEVATNEFYLKGYKDTNLREIATQCGITAGNIYRYYDSKEALFSDILTPVYDDVEQLLMMGPLLLKGSKFNIKIDKLILQPILDLAEHSTKELIIMLTSVEGSNFENMSKKIEKYISEIIRKNMPEIQEYFAYLLSYATIQSFIKILMDHVDTPNEIGDLVYKMIDYFFLSQKGGLSL